MEDVRSGLIGLAMVCGVALFALTLLNSPGVKAEALESNSYFVTISDEEFGEVVYDSRTGVEYWKADTTYSRGVLTMLYDTDGKPLIYEGK